MRTKESENVAREITPTLSVIDRVAIGALAILSLTVVGILITNVTFQCINYSGIINNHITKSSTPNYALILAFSRALDFAVMKTSTVFIGFLLAIVGALYVLRIGSSGYNLTIDAPGNTRFTLQTASPGLVMVTFGIIVVLVALNNKSLVTYEQEADPPSNGTQVTLLPSEGTKDSVPISIAKDIIQTVEKPKQKKPVKVDKRKPVESVGKIFQPRSAVLTANGKRYLESLATRLLADSKTSITIEGETDPDIGSELGIALAERRASVIKKFLFNRSVDARSIKMITYGEESPVIAPTGIGARLTISGVGN